MGVALFEGVGDALETLLGLLAVFGDLGSAVDPLLCLLGDLESKDRLRKLDLQAGGYTEIENAQKGGLENPAEHSAHRKFLNEYGRGE